MRLPCGQYYAECDSWLNSLSSKPAQSSAMELDPSPISRGVSGMKRVASPPLQGEEGLVEEPVPHKVARTSTSNGLIVNCSSSAMFLDQGDRTQNLIYYLRQYQAEQEINRLLGIELEKVKEKEKEQAQKIDSLNELIDSLQSDIEGLNEKKEEASLEIESLKVQTSGLEQELRSISVKAKLAEQQKKNAPDEVIFLRQEKIKYDEKIQQLEHQQEEARQREERLSEQCETYQKEIEKQAGLIRMFHEQSNSFAEKEARLEQEKMQLTARNQELDRQLTERGVQIISQEQAIARLQVGLDEMQTQAAVARTMPAMNFPFTQGASLPPPPPRPPAPMMFGGVLSYWGNAAPPLFGPRISSSSH